MLNRRFHLRGLFAVLLALMAQLGSGATVPTVDLTAVTVLCHTDDNGTAPAHRPSHPADCPVCPLCTAIHVQTAVFASSPLVPRPPAIMAVPRTELPPPSTAPPTLPRPPSQPRAPPTVS